jgi:hypothetical protein
MNNNKTNSEEMENLAVDAMQPQPGTYAFTASLMAEMFPGDDFDWDKWKDEQKDQMEEDEAASYSAGHFHK